MKKILSICLSLTLTIMFVTQVAVADNLSAKKDRSKKTSQSDPKIATSESSQQTHVHEIHGKKIVTEVRQGSAVSLRAAQLRKKNKGFAKAYERLIKRGGKPVFETAGVTLLAVDASQPAMAKTAFNTTQQIVDGDNEISFFPVDNGNPATWEGLIYVRSPSGDGTYAVLHDTTHADVSQMTIYYEEFYPGGGGGGPIDRVSLPRGGRAGSTVLAFNSSPANSITRGYPPLQDFFTCLGIGFQEVGETCLWLGPLFWQCAAIGFVMVIIVCSYQTWWA